MVKRYRTVAWQCIRDDKRNLDKGFARRLRKVSRERQIAFQCLMSSCDGNPVWREYKHRERDEWAFVLPDLEGKCAFRVQTFDLDGFVGHSCHQSLQDASEELVSNRYLTQDVGALNRCSSTLRWALGIKRQEIRLLFSRGKITWAELGVRMEALWGGKTGTTA